jgi:glycosyltransferase involved in cell wall biosynthesis
MPEISVVIPAYNAAATIGETLASVLAQSFNDIEVIVVDDGSTDDTASVAGSCDDPRVKVISVANGGVARARNTGIEHAAGNLVAFIDADDMWRPTKLERQVQALANEPGCDISVTGAMRVDIEGRELRPMPLIAPGRNEDYCKALLLNSMVVGCMSSGLVRRSALDPKRAFNPAFSQCADWDLWLRLSRTSGFALVREELVLYRVHDKNMSSDIHLLERDTFAVLDEFFANPASAPYAPLKRRTYGNHRLICAASYLRDRKLVDAFRCLIAALAVYPLSIFRRATDQPGVDRHD